MGYPEMGLHRKDLNFNANLEFYGSIIHPHRHTLYYQYSHLPYSKSPADLFRI